MDGLSFAALLRRPTAKLKRKELYWHYPHYYPTTSPVSSIRQGDWKLIEYFEDERVELYNLKTDIGESNNLAEKMSKKAKELRDRLHSWRRTVNAQMPVPNPKYRSSLR
jgi:uncharacterized sulfatase